MEFLDDDGLVALWGDIETYVGNETSLDPDGGLERTQDGTSAKLSPTGGIVSTQDGLAISTEQSSMGVIDGALLELTAKGHAEQDGTPSPDNPVEIVTVRGRNLIDESKSTLGSFVSSTNGTFFSFNNGSHSDYIAVDANTDYYLTNGVGTAAQHSGAVFNANKQYLRAITISGTESMSATFNTGDNAAYVIVNYFTPQSNSYVGQPQLELGSTPTPYVPYGYVGLDGSGPLVLEQGAIYSGDGTLVNNSYRVRTRDFIPVEGGRKYYVNVIASQGTPRFGAFYYSDANVNSFISARFWFMNEVLTVPETARYMRIVLSVSEGNQVTPDMFAGSSVHTTTPIPLPSRGWVAGLPDGTADELSVDGAGKVVWSIGTSEVVVNGGMVEFSSGDGYTNVNCVMFTGDSVGVNSSRLNILLSHFRAGDTNDGKNSNRGYITARGARLVLVDDGTTFTDLATANAWLSTHPVTVLYPLATPVTENCGYVDLPDMQDCVLSIPELDALGVRYTIGDGAEIARQWYQRAMADLDETQDAIVDLAAEVTTHEGRITVTEGRLDALQSLRKGADGYYVNETVTSWLARKFDGKIYGYSEPKTTATAVTKTGANAGLPNPTLGTLTERGESVYRDIGPTQWYAAKGYVDSDGVPHVKVIRGVDSQEEWDACTDNVWSLRPVVYYSVDESGVSVNGQLSDTWHAGMKPNPRAYLPDGTMRPYMLAARHALAFEGGVGVSKPGLKGYGRNVSHDSLITLLDYADTGYSGKTEYEQWYDNFMLRIIYGTKDSQGVMKGCTSYDLNYHPTVAETGVKRVILSNANAANLLVGSTMMMGNQATASTDRNNANCYNVFDGLVISSIETYDSANKAVYLDTEDTFDTDPAYLLSTAPWHTGSCGDMDWDGTPTAKGKTSGKEPMFFQGCELMNGNYEVLGDVILSSDGETGWIPYVNEDTKNESTSETSDYVSCVTSLPVDDSDSWKYPLYLSERNGLMYGIQTGGSQTVGICDGHYTNKRAATGLKEWLSLGHLVVGFLAGLACVSGSPGLGISRWYLWSRLSGVGRSKLLA